MTLSRSVLASQIPRYRPFKQGTNRNNVAPHFRGPSPHPSGCSPDLPGRLSISGFSASNPKQSWEVPLPQPREKPCRANPKHQRTHRLPAVPWPAQAKRKLDCSARRKRGRTIPRETAGETTTEHPIELRDSAWLQFDGRPRFRARLNYRWKARIHRVDGPCFFDQN